jgi:hypothetical protein
MRLALPFCATFVLSARPPEEKAVGTLFDD